MDLNKSTKIKYFVNGGSKVKTIAFYIGCGLLLVSSLVYLGIKYRYGLFRNFQPILLMSGLVLASLIYKIFHIFQPKTINIGISDNGIQIGNVTLPYESIKKAELTLGTGLCGSCGTGIMHIIAGDDEYLFRCDYSKLIGPRFLKREAISKMNSINRAIAGQLIRLGFYEKTVFDVTFYQRNVRYKEYRYSNADIDMGSRDYSVLLDAWMCGEDLFLAIDGLVHPLIQEDSPCYVDDCLLVVHKAKLISEKDNENLMTPERIQRMQEFAKKRNKQLYIPFDAFLQNATMDVQDFDYDAQQHIFKIYGYPDDRENPDFEWCALSFKCEKIECFWNEVKDILTLNK